MKHMFLCKDQGCYKLLSFNQQLICSFATLEQRQSVVRTSHLF